VLVNDGHIFDDGPDIWIVCEKHKVKWCAGSNLISGWRDMPEKELLRGHYILSTFHKVDPVLDYRGTAEYSENIRLNRDPLAVPPERGIKADEGPF